MTGIKEEVKKAVKKDKAIFGIKETIKAINQKKTKKIVIANNCPEDYKNKIKNFADIHSTDILVFNGSNYDLGIFCRKPFNVSVLAIIGD